MAGLPFGHVVTRHDWPGHEAHSSEVDEVFELLRFMLGQRQLDAPRALELSISHQQATSGRLGGGGQKISQRMIAKMMAMVAASVTVATIPPF
jgi:hypothetical protein